MKFPKKLSAAILIERTARIVDLFNQRSYPRALEAIAIHTATLMGPLPQWAIRSAYRQIEKSKQPRHAKDTYIILVKALARIRWHTRALVLSRKGGAK